MLDYSELIDLWDEGSYSEVISEINKMAPDEIIALTSLFVRKFGANELDVLERAMQKLPCKNSV